MPDRLSPLDVSFLYLEEPTTPMHVGGVAVFQAPDDGLRLRPAGRPDPRPDRLRAALPPADPLGARPAGQPGLGRRRGLRRHLPRAPVGAARARAPTPSCASSSARVQSRPLDRNRPLWEMYLVEGLVGRPVRDHHARPTTRWSTGSARSTSARSSSTPPRSRATHPQDTWRPAAGAVLGRAGRRRRRRDRAPPERCGRHRPRRPVRRALHDRPGGGRRRRRCSRRPRPRRGLPRTARSTPSIGEQRRYATRRPRPRRLPPRSARRTAAPSTTSCSRPWRAPCAPGC